MVRALHWKNGLIGSDPRPTHDGAPTLPFFCDHACKRGARDLAWLGTELVNTGDNIGQAQYGRYFAMDALQQRRWCGAGREETTPKHDHVSRQGFGEGWYLRQDRESLGTGHCNRAQLA